MTASSDKTGRIWDAASGPEIVRLAHDDEVKHAVWSPDGTRLVAATWDRIARIWAGTNGREVARLVHEDDVRYAEWSPDGTRLVTASWSNTARMWDGTTGKELARLGYDGDVNHAAWSGHVGADGATAIITASDNKTAGIWHVSMTTQALVNAAKVRAPACLTQEQRRAYFLSEAPPT